MDVNAEVTVHINREEAVEVDDGGGIKCKHCRRTIDGATAELMILVTVHKPNKDRTDCIDLETAALCSYTCAAAWAEAHR
jgi:hypothetical protein